MILKLLLPVLAGVSIVLQGTLNKNSAQSLGLASAVLLNALVLVVVSFLFWSVFRALESSPPSTFLLAKPFVNLSWWQFLPGILGFFIVLTTPLSIRYLGATLTFAIIICTQLAISMFWDSIVAKTLPTLMSVAGLVLMYVGLFVLIRGKA